MAVELLENSDREYSLEFDEQEEPQLSKNSSEILKVRHVKVCDSSTAKSKGGADCNAAEPKHRTVQKSKTESTPRTFTDSLQLRNAVYGEWLAKKSSAMKDAQRSIKEEQMKTEIALQRSARKKAEYFENVKKWHERKERELSEKKKQTENLVKKKQEEAIERNLQKQESAGAFKMWKQNKTRYLMEEHKKKKKDIEDMEQEKKEKAEERMTVSEKAFLAWSERKDEIIKENVRKQQEEKTFKQWKRQEEMRERAEQAKKAYDEWMNKKQRNDSNTNICAPKPPWCPARSLHFVSPDRLTRVQAARTESTQRLQEKACGYTNDGKESTNSQGTEDEYMLDSFSDASSSSMASEDTAADVQSSPNNSLARDSTGTLKTVQVCCKTLKYWCKCDV